MISGNSFNIEFLDCYVFGDQPMTCGKCGARTDFEELNDEFQKHQCLNVSCGYTFFATGNDLIHGLV